MTFAPVPLNHDDFIEHVSKDIVQNGTTPNDFEATLWYVLYQLPERNREVFLKIERDHTPVRAIGMEYGVSGQRISDLNKTTKERIMELWGSMLKTGIMEYVKENASRARDLGKADAKLHYYSIGYTDGYEDGIRHKPLKHYATEEFNDISLTNLSLSYRTHHYLFDNNMLNVSNILECGDGIMKIKHLGKKSIEELLERLLDFGVDIKHFFPKTIAKYEIKVEE